MNNSFGSISVVIPVFNQEQYIADCINSVLEQDIPDCEIIVVDDGSTDSTKQVVSGFKDKVRVVSQSNQGVSQARNRGVEEAFADWILFLDSDDLLLPGYFEMVNRAVNEHEVGLVYGDAEKVSEAGEVVGCTGTNCQDELEVRGLASVFENPYIPMSGMLVKRNLVVDCGGFDTSLKTAEDTDILLKIATSTDILHINQNIVRVLRRENSLSAITGTYSDELNVYNRFCQQNPGFCNENETLVKRVRARTYQMWGDTLLYNGNNIQAFNRLLVALAISFQKDTVVLLVKCFIPSFLKRMLRGKAG